MSTSPPSPQSPQSPPPRSSTPGGAKPWYRHGWVWFLFGIPASAIIAGSITIWIAVSTADSLVADDYYKEGRAINQRLEKDQAAVDSGISLSSSITTLPSGVHRIEVVFAANPGVATPEFIRLKASHPTQNQRDILATLSKTGQFRFSSDVPGMTGGRWYVQLEDQDSSWRVRATWNIE